MHTIDIVCLAEKTIKKKMDAFDIKDRFPS